MIQTKIINDKQIIKIIKINNMITIVKKCLILI
jgi:hypothetical protein